jgi:hypothetical protein
MPTVHGDELVVSLCLWLPLSLVQQQHLRNVQALHTIISEDDFG